MWESIGNALSSPNGRFICGCLLATVVFLMFVAIWLGKNGILKINGKWLKLSNGVSERELIRRQAEAAHDYIMSIEGKLDMEVDKSKWNGYYLKYILEKVYDKAIEWIIFNHITTNQLYMQDKQDTICNLVYSMGIDEKFKTPEFKMRMCKWTRELIERLVCVKTLYSQN